MGANCEDLLDSINFRVEEQSSKYTRDRMHVVSRLDGVIAFFTELRTHSPS